MLIRRPDVHARATAARRAGRPTSEHTTYDLCMSQYLPFALASAPTSPVTSQASHFSRWPQLRTCTRRLVTYGGGMDALGTPRNAMR